MSSRKAVFSKVVCMALAVVAIMWVCGCAVGKSSADIDSHPASIPAAVSAITGTLVPGDNLSEKLAWLGRSADSHNTYIIEVNADESIARHIFGYRGAINITVVIRGDNVNRTIRLQSNGYMFAVDNNVTLILDNNITLRGHNGNTDAVVKVGGGGTFKMNAGSSIIGNTNNNTTSIGASAGSGVKVSGGTFEMNGGTISGNTASYGGGVGVNGGTFIMRGGTITGNIANKWGGGVCMPDQGIATFNMAGGVITGNISRGVGGGVYVGAGKQFTKTGGTITGLANDPKGNAVADEANNAVARRDHAVYVTASRRKETTAGPGANLTAQGGRAGGGTGAWDQ